MHHQIEYRCDGHLFITVLAYHVLQTIRLKLKAHGITHGWATIRRALSTHYRMTTSIKRSDGKVVYLRKTARPEECHIRIYNALGLPSRPGDCYVSNKLFHDELLSDSASTRFELCYFKERRNIDLSANLKMTIFALYLTNSFALSRYLPIKYNVLIRSTGIYTGPMPKKVPEKRK